MNIVEMILKMLGGDTGKQLAASLGEGEGSTETAVKAVVPALLAALTGMSSAPEGAAKLASAVEGADDSILSNLGSLMGGQGSKIPDQGTSLLGSLLSGGMLGNLGSVLAKFTGMKPATMATLLGYLAPVILGFLRRETKSTGFDPASLSKLLVGQKDNIAKSLPSGLGSQLAGIPGLGSLNSLFQGAPESVATAANRATVAGSQAKVAAALGAGAIKFIVPLLLALGLGWLAWTFWPAPGAPAPVVNRNPQAATTVTAAKVTDEIFQQVSKATTGVTGFFSDATRVLQGVTDVASAEQAAEKLPGLIDRLGELKRLTAAIPVPQRETIFATIANSRESLFTLIDKLMQIPGVEEVLAPHVDKLRAALDDLTA